MRHQIVSRHPRRARSRVLAGVAALLALIAVGIAGCSGGPQPAPTPPVSAPGVAPMAESAPVRVRIPAIGVDSALTELGVRADGTMEVPAEGFPAGWFSGAPTPGELGPAVLAGHVDWRGQPGVFSRLRELKPEDEVTVAREDGSAAVFRVTRVEQFPKDEFPTAVVYGDIDHAGLRLITCGGSLDRQAHSYDDNVVAFARLVGVAEQPLG